MELVHDDFYRAAHGGDDELVRDRPHYWLDPGVVDSLESTFADEVAVHFSRIAGYIATTVQPGLFSNLVHSGVYYWSAGRLPFGDPKLEGSGRIGVATPNDRFPLGAVQHALQQLPRVGEQRHKMLDTVRHWYLEARKEKDPWKRFLWTFLALEVMTRKLSSVSYASVTNRLVVEDSQFHHSELVAQLIADPERLTLLMHFIIVALQLSPNTASDDVEKFRLVKKVRDRLSHGDVRRADEFPLNEADDLLRRYFMLANNQ